MKDALTIIDLFVLQEANRVKLDMEGNLKNLQKKIEDYEKDAQQFSSQIQVIRLLTLKTGYFNKLHSSPEQINLQDVSC